MQELHNNALVQSLPWFKTWFDSPYYHQLYTNRNEKEAALFIDKLVAALQPEQNATMLDVGCGNGRHCKQLALKGFDVTGIDLSLASIRMAKKQETASLRFFQHDMRQPFGKSYFDYVFNFFTSFGYFKSKDEHSQVIINFSRALKQGGKLVLDYMNIYHTEQQLVPKEEKEIDGIIYHITRWMDDQYFFKQIVIDKEQAGETITYTEQVARFNLDDFSKMFSLHNLELEEMYGDYELNEFDKEKSPRLIMIARKLA